MARNKKVEILSNDGEVLHPITDGDCVIFSDGKTLTQKLSEDDSVKYTPEVTNSSPMFKVGEGDTVDYSANVLDGAYERAVLKGQTYVNYIQEPSADIVTLPTPFTNYEGTQHNTLTSGTEGTLGINLVGQSYVNALQQDSEEEFVVLGESLEFQNKKVEYTKEGQIKSAMLKGQTLVNLDCQGSTIGTLIGWTKENGYHIVTKPTDKTCGRNFTKRGGDFTRGEKILIVIDNQGDHLNLYGRQNYQGIGITFQQGLTKHVFTIGDSSVPGLVIGRLDNIEANIKFRVMFLEYQEGMENWDIPYFEGMQSVTVSTKLENLCNRHNKNSITKTGKTFTVLDYSTRTIDIFNAEQAATVFKPNTKYLIQFTISNLVLDGIESIPLTFSNSNISAGNSLFGDTSQYNVSQNGVHRIIRTTTHLIGTSNCLIKGLASEWENSGSSLRKMTISNIMYIEYQNGMENWDLPYFEDYQVMKPVQVESVNKNLLEVPNVSITTRREIKVETSEGVFKLTGTANGSGGRNDLYEEHGHLFSLNLKKGKAYTMSIIDLVENGSTIDGFFITDSNTSTALFRCSSENNFVCTYTPLIDMDVHFGMNVLANETYNSTFKVLIEESDTATIYVPHQSKTTYSWDEVVLRKVGDVEDTLDLTTGEWVQRIGEVTLDGSEYFDTSKNYFWYINQNLSNENYTTFMLDGRDGKPGSSNFICDKLPNKPTWLIIETGVWADSATILTLPTSIATTTLQLKEYLQTNQLRIQYELATPIVHKVNLSRPNLQTYDDITHVHTKCLDGTLVPNIYLPSDISYPTMLEPNTQYNVCVNHTEVNADNPLKVNVGGTEITMTDSRMTLTTPTTLAHSNVLFTGKGNKIKESMLIKNSGLITGDLPHFNGIGSVQLGKTIENLCSASDFKVGNSNATIIQYDNYVHTKISKAGSCVFTYELVKLLENGKKYFVYSPQTLGNDACRTSFRQVYNNDLTYVKQQTVLPKDGKCIIEIDQTDNPYTHICVGCHHDLSLNTEFDMYRPIICEYEPSMENWDWESIGYFTGTKNIGNEFMKVQNKNLFDGINKGYYLNFDTSLVGLSNNDNGGIVDIGNMNNVTISSTIPQSRFRVGCINKLLVQNDRAMVYNGVNLDSNPSAKATINCSNYKYLIINADDLTKIQVEESSTATAYTAHRHNGLYITKDQPIELTWEQGRINPSGVGDSYTNAINNAVSYGIRNKGLLNLKPNTTYRVSLGDKANFKYHIAIFDNWDNALASSSLPEIGGDWVSSRDTIFTTTKDVHKIGITVQKQDSSSTTPPESVHAQVRLEEVTDVVLRGIGNVHDELDITRGIYTQRIGEVVLDGSETWAQHTASSLDKTHCFSAKLPYIGSMQYSTPLCTDKMSNHTIGWNDDKERIWINEFDNITLHLFKYKCDSMATLKQYLSQNPITIQYVLATPIVHKVHIGNKNESNKEVAKPNDVFTLPTLYTEQTHIDLQNEGLMPKVESRDYIAYSTINTVGKTYTLVHNNVGSKDLTIDLCGKTQTLPYSNYKGLISTNNSITDLTHNELRISGANNKVNHVMLIDGGYMDRDIPYIEGMKNAVNPIVKNIGKNLISFDNMYSSYITNGSLSCVNNIVTRLKDSYNDIQLFIYLINGKHYYFGLDGSIGVGGTQQPKIVLGRMYGWQEFPEQQKIAPNQDFIYRGQTGWTTLHMVNIVYINNIYITEVQGHENCEPYKENICYVDCGEIRLTEDMFEQGTVLWSNLPVGTPLEGGSGDILKYGANNRIRLKGVMPAKPNTKYMLIINDSYDHLVLPLDGQKCRTNYSDNVWVTKGQHIITTTNNTEYITYVVSDDGKLITPSDFSKLDFKLFELDSIRQLRSLPNGVYDEIDLETGKYIQRVGEVVLDGSDDEGWELYEYSAGGAKYFRMAMPTMKQHEDIYALCTHVICDKLENVRYHQDIYSISSRPNSVISFAISSALNSQAMYIYQAGNQGNLAQFKQWLQSNPITVQYLLADPIVKDIVVHNYPHSYKGGYVIIENSDPNTSIPAQLTYRAVTNRSGQIQQHTEQVEKQEREINELETLILENIRLGQNRTQQYSTNLSTISLDVEEEE